MATTKLAVTIYLNPEEHADLLNRGAQAGYRSPALFLRALYRSSLNYPENVRSAMNHAEVVNIMRNEAARLVSEFLHTITTEELLGAIDRKVP